MKSRTAKTTLQLLAICTNVTKRIDRSISALHGIGLTEFTVLNQLSAAPNLTMSRIQLAESIGLSASGITRLIVPMEKIGLVEKERNNRDARVSLVKLSRAGKKLHKNACASFVESSDTVFQSFQEKQLNTFSSLLAKIQ